MLLFFALVSSVPYIFENPIECLMPPEFPSIWKNYVNKFCYASNLTNIHDFDDSFLHERNISLSWYQWFPFILVIQAVLNYLPNLISKFVQLNQTIDVEDVVLRAKCLQKVMGDERRNGVNDIVTYLKQQLQFNDPKKIGFGMKISLHRILFKFLTIIVIITELLFMNKIIQDGKNTFWSINNLKNIFWDGNIFFPHAKVCKYGQPVAGGTSYYSVQCILTANVMNGKIFVFVWLWLIITLLFSFGNLFYLAAKLFFTEKRHRMAKDYVQLSSVSSDISLSQNENHRKFDFLGADGYYLFESVKLQAGSLITNEIASKLFNIVYNADSPTVFKTTNG
uniref:Innexin n=1 Tax=Panagrolaimus superbus TaxID=310955 RepID=A0A914YCK2_9BILA